MDWNSTISTSEVTEGGAAREYRSFPGGGSLAGSFGQSAYLPAPVLSGVAVTNETALTLIPYYACILALSTDLASLTREVKRRRPGKGTVAVPEDPRYELVYCEPNRNTTSIRFWQAIYGHRFSWGNGFSEIKRTRSGMPAELHLHSPRPTDTWAERSKNGSIWYQLDGGRRAIRAEDMVHLAGMGFNGLEGYSPVALHRQGVGYGLAMEQQGASFYGNALTPRGALKVQKSMSPEAFRNLRESMSSVHAGPENANRLLILEEGMEFQQLSVNPVDAEYIAGRRYQLNEICRMFQVPPPRIQDFLGVTGVYKAFDDLIQAYISFTLGPEIVAEQQWINRVFFTRRERAHGLHLAHDWTALSRGNLGARTAYYKARFEMHSLTPDEIREREGDNPTGTDLGKEFFVGNAYKPASVAGAGSDPDPDPPPADGPPEPPDTIDGLNDPDGTPEGEEGDGTETTSEIEGNNQ